jgi:hypothetical protein
VLPQEVVVENTSALVMVVANVGNVGLGSVATRQPIPESVEVY